MDYRVLHDSAVGAWKWEGCLANSGRVESLSACVFVRRSGKSETTQLLHARMFMVFVSHSRTESVM